jgi:hypothetical protein
MEFRAEQNGFGTWIVATNCDELDETLGFIAELPPLTTVYYTEHDAQTAAARWTAFQSG